MKKRLLFSMIIVTVFISLIVSQPYAKLDVLREVDNLVDASKPNVLLIIATDKFMTRAAGESGGGVSTNKADDPVLQSRMYMVKDVLAGFSETGVLDATKDVINYGLMAYNQTGYYPYYTTDCYALLQQINEHPTAFAYKFDIRYLLKKFFASIITPRSAFANGGCSGAPDRTETTFKGSSFSDGGTTYYYFNFIDASLSQYPIDPGTAGKLWVPIDTSNSLTPPTSPTAIPAASSDEITVIKEYLDLQNNGGLAIDTGSAGSIPAADIFRNNDGVSTNDAYEYFRDIVIPGDTHSNSGCFTKNYIIFLSDGFGNTSDFTTAASDANALYNLTVSGNSTPVKTFVIGVIDPEGSGMSNMRSRLNQIARNGGTDASEKIAYGLQRTSIPADHGGDFAFFVTDRAELKEAFLNIASAIAAGDFVTGSPSATSSSGSFVLNNVGMLASAEYPEWRGHLRSVDLVNDYFWWDAGVSLVIPTADTKLPKAVVDAMATDSHASWRDTDGDGSVDQPPLMLKLGSNNIYRYTDRVLYCKTTNYTSNNCVSSALISNEYVGTTANFTIGGTETSYTYKGAFYMPPYADRKIYTSNLSGTVLDISVAGNLSVIKFLAGWTGVIDDNYANAIISFARGAIDADKSGTVDTGVDLNEDGVIDATEVNGIVENTAEVTREWWLGDVTNVVTVGVGKPINPKDGLSGRDTFRNVYAGRDTIVYTGSNDQMLHAYDFETGVEKFAYIPPDLLSNLKTLYDNAMAATAPEAFMGQPANPTDHIYGIASSPKVNDVQFADGTWHTVLVSGEGPGGNHYFALDVTDPTQTFGTSGANPYTLLWHTITTSPNLAGSYGSTLGETWSVPAFGRIMDGTINKWVVFVGSGYDDTSYGDGKGEIFHVINVEDGTLLTSPGTTGNFFMAGSSPTVQYGLLPDSVSMIQKSGSKVEDGYQVDLKGRAYHIDTSNISTAIWNKTEILAGASVADFTNPTTAKPFYYSPAVWDFDNASDTSKHLMVLGSGAYDDPEMERRGDDDDGDGVAASNEEGDSLRNPTISADLTTTLYFTIVDPTTPAVTDAFSIEISAVTGVEVDEDGNITGTVSAGTLTGGRLIASPVLFNNEVSPGTFELQALFLIFVPPAAGQLGCSFGNSYLLVFSLGNADTIVSGNGFASTSDLTDTKSGTAQFVVSMGTGKVSGIGVAGGGSHVVVGQSGYGGGDTSGFNTAGGDNWDPIGTTTKLYWKEE